MSSHKKLNLITTLVILIALMFPAFNVKTARAAPPGGTTPTIWVNDTGDAPDADGVAPCDTGTGTLPTGRQPCTLRAAIQVANARTGADVIAFEFCSEDNMAIGDVADSYRISPTSPLPALTDGLTYVNGYTQGYPSTTRGFDDTIPDGHTCTAPRMAIPNTNNFSQALNTILAVEIDGSACISPVPEFDADQTTLVLGGVIPSGSIIQWNATAGACSGFTVTSDQNVFAGLNIRNWRNAGILIMPLIYSQANKPSGNTLWGDFIGTNVTGDTAQANRFGVEIIGGSDGNFIGDTMAIPSWGIGTRWLEEPTNSERNLISGNNNPHFVYGYFCAEGGIFTNFRDDGAGVFLGVDPCIRRNGTSGGSQAAIFTGGALDNHVRNSYIGSDYQGINPVPNSVGVWLNYDAGREGTIPGNHIGGCLVLPFTPGANAACSPQTDHQQDPNLISGNRRLTTGGVQQTLGGHGIWMNGYTSVAQREGTYDVSYNEIGGNFIGTTADGLGELPNSGNGVYLLSNNTTTGGSSGPDHNEIGATTAWVPQAVAYRAPYAGLQPYRFGNVISANGDPNELDNTYGRWDNGVEIRGANSSFNYIGYGNAIGVNSQGNKTPLDLGNGENGVFISSGADDNYIYNNSSDNISSPFPLAPDDLTSTFGAISDNGDFSTAEGRNGVRISNNAYYNHIFRNCIGGDAINCGGTNFGNHFAGISMVGGAVHNWVGLYQWTGNDVVDNQGNWIHHNGSDGVQVVDVDTGGTAIRYNRIWRNGDPGDVVVDGNLGIDLVDDNDTINDVGDLDAGSNLQQNYPDNRLRSYPWLISFTEPDGCTDPNCVIDIYATLVSDSDWTNDPNTSDPQVTNNGEGRYWLASVVGSATNLDISTQVAAAFGGTPSGEVCISLTTTRYDEDVDPFYSIPYRNTSEFTPCLGFTPTVVTLKNLSAHANGTLPAMALAGFSLLVVSAAGLIVWRRRVTNR